MNFQAGGAMPGRPCAICRGHGPSQIWAATTQGLGGSVQNGAFGGFGLG